MKQFWSVKLFRRKKAQKTLTLLQRQTLHTKHPLSSWWTTLAVVMNKKARYFRLISCAHELKNIESEHEKKSSPNNGGDDCARIEVQLSAGFATPLSLFVRMRHQRCTCCDWTWAFFLLCLRAFVSCVDCWRQILVFSKPLTRLCECVFVLNGGHSREISFPSLAKCLYRYCILAQTMTKMQSVELLRSGCQNLVTDLANDHMALSKCKLLFQKIGNLRQNWALI